MSQVIENSPTPGASTIPQPHANFVAPTASVRSTTDGYVLDVALPGVPKSAVEVTFDDGTLTVTGHRADLGHGDAVYRESAEASFRRAFQLDPAIDVARIEANLERGILSLHLPKAESARPRQIVLN